MFGWEYPPHITGGLGTACYGLTKGLVSFDDVNITFVVPKTFGDENKTGIKLIGASDVELPKEIVDRIKKLCRHKYHELYSHVSAYISPEQYKCLIKEKKAALKNPVKNTPSNKIDFSGKYGDSLFDEIYRFGMVSSEIAKKEDPDIIHAHDWLTFQAGIEAKRISGKPLIAHVHATEYDRSGEHPNKKVYSLEKRGMQEADLVITVSDFTRNIVIKRYGISPDKVITVHNAAEPLNNTPGICRSSTNDRIVTFLGRITSQKGPAYFIDAAYKILKKTNNVRFVMAGTGDLMEKLIRYVASLGISDRFHFTGFLRGDDVYRMYGMSDLYVMPSVSEPFGISSLEALQSGVPVIISKQSGVSEVIKHAIKIDFWDVDRLADAIYATLNYSGIKDMMTARATQEAMSLKWTDTARKIRDIYYRLAYRKAG
jgi:glycosyltransferase involved in cell wall biosynthesis